MQAFKWGRGVSKDEGPIWGGVNESSENWNPTKSWSQWMIQNITPTRAQMNLAQNSLTFPTWPFIFQNIAFAASFWQPMPNLLSKQILLLNKFNETSSCSEIRPWSKLASTLKNKAGHIVCQILSSNMKEQKPKKHSLSSSLPLSSHVSTSFYLSPLPFILDMMCQKNDI